MKKVLTGLIAACFCMTMLAGCGTPASSSSASASGSAAASASSVSAAKQTAIDYWSLDSASMRSIVEFVSASVDPSSSGYIPKEDRVAVFDMDGTLYGERFPTYFNDWLFIQRALHDDSYQAPEDLKAFAQAWEDKVLKGTLSTISMRRSASWVPSSMRA